MILDERTEFADSFDLDQETGTYLFTNQIDTGATPTLKNLGNGQPVYLCFEVTEAFTDGGDSATATFQLRSDDTATIHASTSTLHYASTAFLKAALPLGKKWCVPLPVEDTYERYLGVQCIVGTAGFDTGMVTAGLSLDPNGWIAYPDALA